MATFSVKDVNDFSVGLTGNNNVLIKYVSNAKATITTSSTDEVVLDEDSCTITNGGETGLGLTHTFYGVEDDEFIFVLRDIDGREEGVSMAFTMVDYVPLTCSIANSVIDGNGNVTITCSGNSFNESFGKVTNNVVAKCRYKAVSDSSYSGWRNMTETTREGGGYSASVVYDSSYGLDYALDYIFEVKVTDEIGEVTTKKVLSSKPIFHWGKDDFTFEVPVRIGNDILPTGSSVGNYLRFGDKSNCYIAEKGFLTNTSGEIMNDDYMTIYARSGINLETNGNVYIKGTKANFPESGTWEPEFDTNGIVSSTTRCEGWYNKVGNVVTVGFFIKVTCTDGWHETPIKIYGLPYYPKYSAAGGGMCSGAYVSAGFNFQCFVAEQDEDYISMRVQGCNHTSKTNLRTSATGCWFPENGGELTLSGTITYIT